MEDRNPSFPDMSILSRYVSGDDQGIKSLLFEPISSDYERPLVWRKSQISAWKFLNAQDRISDLPEALLLHIVSFLDTKDAIKTSVLSKRWSKIWTFLPSLSFTSDSDNFASFVKNTLRRHRAPKVSKFFIEFEYASLSKVKIHLDRCLLFAKSAKVQELSLQFFERSDYEQRYSLPLHFFVNEFITALDLRYCKIHGLIISDGLINWSSLKRLSIGHTALTNRVLREVLLGSPRLEFLELYYFCVISRLDIVSQSLKKLVIREYHKLRFLERYDDFDMLELEIVAPNIQALEISGHFCKTECRLKNVASLVEAKIDFDMLISSEDDYEDYGVMVRGLIESLHHVKELTIGRSCLSVLSIMSVKHLPSSLLKCTLSNCKHLIVKTILEKWDLHGITILLQSSPCLETLVIDADSFMCPPPPKILLEKLFNSYNYDGESYWKSKEMFLECLQLHLKTVIFGDLFYGNELFISLVQFLLRNARVLEKMVIRKSGIEQMQTCDTLQNILQVAQKLLSFPKSSPHAVVMFPHK